MTVIKVNPDRCPQDHACPMISWCPQSAIKQEGFGLPTIDDEKCIKCMACVNGCPLNAFEKN